MKNPWNLNPNIAYHKKNFEDFWVFVYERQMIWYKRFILKQPWPWTMDKILRKYKFTNVYRELDVGTLWLLKKIVKPNKGNPKNLFFQIILYRLLNRVQTFEDAFLPTYENWKYKACRTQFRKALYTIRKAERPVFTSAHLTLVTIEQYISNLTHMHKELKRIIDECDQAPILQRVHKIIKSNVRKCGDFIAAEIITDLMYAKVIPFNEDDWVHAGPGCKVGIELIFPKAAANKEWMEMIQLLRSRQRRVFQELKLKFQYYDGKDLSLKNIEHSLCEFGKYWKLKNKCGKARQLYHHA